jgi:hypothetical protein
MLQGARARATNRHKNTKERVVTAAYSRCQEHAGIALRRRDQVAAINVNGAFHTDVSPGCRSDEHKFQIQNPLLLAFSFSIP